MVGATLLVASPSAYASPYWNDPFDRAGPIEKHDPTPIWLDKLMDGGSGGDRHSGGPSVPSERHRDHGRRDRHRRYSDDDRAPTPYLEDMARDNADERTEEDDRDTRRTPWQRNLQCSLYRVEYMVRHGAHTPKPLRRYHGCSRWTRDHYYWQERRGIDLAH